MVKLKPVEDRVDTYMRANYKDYKEQTELSKKERRSVPFMIVESARKKKAETNWSYPRLKSWLRRQGYQVSLVTIGRWVNNKCREWS